jgi:methyl-accepting chemotaxis protein
LFFPFTKSNFYRPTVAFAGILLAIAILLFGLVLDGRNASSTLQSAMVWEMHTEDVLSETGRLLSALQDAETGQRGYLLTKQSEFLEPYDAGRRDAVSSLDRLGAMTSDNAAQQVRVANLRKVMASQFAVLSETLSRPSAVDSTELAALVDAKRLMDEAREILASIATDERQLLATRHGWTQRTTEIGVSEAEGRAHRSLSSIRLALRSAIECSRSG